MQAKPQMLQAIPVLPTADIDGTLRFYTGKLGFVEEFRAETYAGVMRDGVDIHFRLCPERNIAENTSSRIQVRGIDELYDEYRAEGVIHRNGSLATKPWGLREFSIVDESGNTITFAEPAAAA